MQPTRELTADVLAAYGLDDAELHPIVIGNINLTYRVEHKSERFILQRLNRIFGPEVHFDIELITSYLLQAEITTPTLLRNTAGALWTEDKHGDAWRVLTYIEGLTYSQAPTPSHCSSAGRLAARFHTALADVEYVFRNQRGGVHDTERHLRDLESVLATHRQHQAYDRVAPVAAEILNAAMRLPRLPDLPMRIVHGDMKLNNVVFSKEGRALALIDLDTLSHMSLPVELGDAMRSWCNTRSEDAGESDFNMEHFHCALVGYRDAAPELLRDEEKEALPLATETIILELASRFAADALAESYFSWDRKRYAAAWEHNLERARGQLSLFGSYARQRGEAERIVKETL